MDAAATLDADRCYRALESRDQRFDGQFIVGVRTTGIYCRPSCPAPVRPRRSNVEFFHTAAAAQCRGFRACKRCRPDAVPGSPAWDERGDLVGRAMRLLADGVVDREGVTGLARQLAVSERHLHRLLVDNVGAGPLAIARARRATTARVLIETTPMGFADVAFAAGFSSVRQFNDVIGAVFALTPTQLRRHAAKSAARPFGRLPAAANQVVVRLAYRDPLDVDGLLGWFSHRVVPGLVEVRDGSIIRTLRLPNGGGVVRLTPADGYFSCALDLVDLADLSVAVERVRRLLDLDVDPAAVSDVLSRDRTLRTLVERCAGLRVPGSVDGLETTALAIAGQQISVSAALAILGRLVDRYGTPAPVEGWRLFPTAADLVDADLADVGLTDRGAEALRQVARLVAGGLLLEPGADRESTSAALLGIVGIGPWTADYVRLRALRDPDVLLSTDLIARRGAERIGLPAEAAPLNRVAAAWAPWRSYATHHLWGIGSAEQPRTKETVE